MPSLRQAKCRFNDQTVKESIMLDVKAMFADEATNQEQATTETQNVEEVEEQKEVVEQQTEQVNSEEVAEEKPASSPADSLKKAMSVPVTEYVKKKHELKSEKEAREQLEAENKQLREQLETKADTKLDINKYLEGIAGDELIDGDKMKTVLTTALSDIASQAFKAGQDAAQDIYKQQQEKLAEEARENEKKSMAEKIESDVAEFMTKNPDIDLEAISSMLTVNDVKALTKMSGNYAENAFNLVKGKAAKLGIVQKEEQEPEQPVDALFDALSGFHRRLKT